MIKCDNCNEEFDANVLDGICPNCGSDNSDQAEKDGDYEDNL